MSRTIAQLHAEAEKLGICVSGSSEDVREMLAERIWKSSNSNTHMPRQFKVMLAKDASKLNRKEFGRIFNNSDWVAELKLNGCRGVMVLEEGEIARIHSRRRSDIHHRYEEKGDSVPQFQNFNWDVRGLTVLDGELVHDKHKIVTESGTETANQLQVATSILNSGPHKSVATQIRYGNLKYWVFDILFYQGLDVRKLANWERHKLLTAFVEPHVHPDIRICPRYELPLNGFYELYLKMINEDAEGIMLKLKSAPYVTKGRPKSMWKLKRFVTYDAFISGFVPSTVGKELEDYIGAFEVSAYIDGVETVIGAVSGMDMNTRMEATNIVNNEPALSSSFYGRVVEVKGQEVTKNGKLAHCEIVQWRPDKGRNDCQIEGSLYYGKK